MIEGTLVYIAIGLIGRRLFGYEGILETLLWPIAIPIVIYMNNKKDK